MPGLKRYITRIYNITKLAPLYSIWLIVLTVLMGIVPAIETMILAELFNKIQVDGVRNNIILYMMLFILIMTIDMIMPQLCRYVEINLENALRASFCINYFAKKSTLPYYLVEKNDIRDLINRIEAQNEGYYKCFSDFLKIGGVTVQLISSLVIVAVYSRLAATIILIASVPIIYISYYFGNKNYKIKVQTNQNVRFMNYLSEVLVNKEYLRERYLFDYVQAVSKAWSNIYEYIRKLNSGLELKRNLFSKIDGIISLLLFMCVILILLIRFFEGKILIGSFSAICQRMFTIIDLLSNEVTQNMYAVVKDEKYLSDIRVFFELPEEKENIGVLESISLKPEEFKKLEFRNVCFKYPGTEKNVLEGLSFVIEKGKSYALVGSNSAGKSTIIKLILGLYQNYEGRIMINDIDIKKIPLKTLHNFYAVVFQDFAKYELTVKENIELSQNIIDDYDIMRILNEVKLDEKVQKFLMREETPIGRLYKHSVEISGGEWQKIAVGRCLANKAPIRILDEPTSNLDPTYELEFFEKFHTLNKAKTIILVSHRLGSTRFADKILVLKDGRIIETGKFDELIHLKGVYNEMFQEQQKWYL